MSILNNNVIGFVPATIVFLCSTLAHAVPDSLAPSESNDDTTSSRHSHMAGMGMMTSPMTSYLSDPTGCQGSMEAWDYAAGMCMPLPMAGMPMQMVMLHGNAFGVGITEQGPRGRRDFAAPNMFMIDAGSSVGDVQYVNLEFMGTVERWSFPEAGYPELFQIGERNGQGRPFIDAQHPHNSPVMGLTLSDTIRLPGAKNHLKLFFAPRGESTDGPVAFMHRPTGMVNPDAPLGHHIGQDVGHITSTVIGASLKLAETTLEASTFKGQEPEPTKVDLPVGKPDSWAGRIIQEISPRLYVVASGAYVHAPESDEPELTFLTRYSASVYATIDVMNGWKFYNALICGLIHNYDHTSLLTSYGEEFLLRGDGPNIWGRIEYLQRTAAELAVQAAADPNRGLWFTAITLGYTHTTLKQGALELGVGGAVTKDFLPSEFKSAYTSGGNSPDVNGSAINSPWTAKVFVQLSGMKMFGMVEPAMKKMTFP